ncbi:MAG: hypothetical protein KDA84_05355, partial [Planctomycetaceae bacterium]|nr:hypothetical protein [Planctomycetaceae bacterium]
MSGHHPKVMNVPVTPQHPLITPKPAVQDIVERDPAPPVPAIHPIPVPQTQTVAKPTSPLSDDKSPTTDPWSQNPSVKNAESKPHPSNPFEMPVVQKPSAHPLQSPKISEAGQRPTPPIVKTNPNRVNASPFSKPTEDVKITPHAFGSRPVTELQVTEKSRQPLASPFEMPVVQERQFAPPRPAITQKPTKPEPKQAEGNPFEMPVVQERQFAPPRPAITQAPTKPEPKPAEGNPFEMPVVKEQTQQPSAPVAKTSANPQTPFEMPSVAQAPTTNKDSKDKTSSQNKKGDAHNPFVTPAPNPKPQPAVKEHPSQKVAAPTTVTGNPFAVIGTESPQSQPDSAVQPKQDIVTKPEEKVAEN